MPTSPQFRTKLTHLRSFYSVNLALLRRASFTLVRSILEYATHIRNPFSRKSVNDREHVHRHLLVAFPHLNIYGIQNGLPF